MLSLLLWCTMSWQSTLYNVVIWGKLSVQWMICVNMKVWFTSKDCDQDGITYHQSKKIANKRHVACWDAISHTFLRWVDVKHHAVRGFASNQLSKPRNQTGKLQVWAGCSFVGHDRRNNCNTKILLQKKYKISTNWLAWFGELFYMTH